MPKTAKKISIGDYDRIMSDRNIFNQIVYTPLSEALRLLEERQKDPVLIAKVEELLKGDIPEPLKNIGKNAVIFRQVATPNHESRCFCSLAKENGMIPVFFEYHNDKFTSNNDFKHSLGQIHINGSVNKKNKYPVEKITIVDFAKYDGKKLKEIITIWDEPLVSFHKRLFIVNDQCVNDLNFYDASSWIKNNGNNAVNYYVSFFFLMVCYGILFENFLLDDHNDGNGKFTKEVVLPAIEKVMNLTGVKPLIVPITPIDIEKDNYWVSFNSKIKKLINK